MNSKIAMSGLSILASLAVMGGATFAYFSDAGSSTANAFSTGNLNMLLSDASQTDLDSVDATFGLSGGAPGATFTGDLKIKNAGSIPADHVELQFVNGAPVEGSGPGAVSTTPLPKVIEVQSLLWDHDGDGVPTVDVLAGIVDQNLNGITDLEDVANQAADDFDNLVFGGTQAADHVLRISGRFSPTLMVDEHQGDSVVTTLNVTMNQNASQ